LFLRVDTYIQSSYYRSHLMIPAAFFVIVAAVYALFQEKASPVARYIAPGLVAGVAFAATVSSFNGQYASNHQRVLAVIEQARAQGVQLGYIPMRPGWINPGISYAIGPETLLRSALDGKGAASLVYEDALQTLLGEGFAQRSDMLIETIWTPAIPLAHVNRTYFAVESGPYRPVSLR
jgi:hypothetical protein